MRETDDVVTTHLEQAALSTMGISSMHPHSGAPSTLRRKRRPTKERKASGK